MAPKPERLSAKDQKTHDESLTEAAEDMAVRAEAIKNAVVEAMTVQTRRWRRTAIVLGIGLLLLAVITVASYQQSRDNGDILDEIHNTQVDTKETADFVRCLKTHPTREQSAVCFTGQGQGGN